MQLQAVQERKAILSALIPFDSVRVGEELGPFEVLVSEEAVRQYCADWTDANPWYSGPSPFGGPVAPPAFMAGVLCFRLLGSRFNARATIGAQTAHRNLAPLPVGQRMITRGVIAGKYVKRGLEYVVITSTSYAGDGTPVRESTDHILLSVERAEVGTDGGRS
jgi:hypothetical protein